ncbi:MAG: low molecular weight protein arginine phosphatase [Christensenellales bacterium]
MNVLFVCTGNTCRSPMAEGIAGDAAGKSARLKNMAFKSAGTFACEGAPASEEAISALAEKKLDLSRHRARQFSKELGEWADLILAMEARHIEEMEAMAPGQADKMHTLLGFAAEAEGYPGESGCNILDPYREPIEFYRKTRDQIAKAVDKTLRRIKKQQK